MADEERIPRSGPERIQSMFEANSAVDGQQETIVYESRDHRECSDRALVLLSVGIPYKILSNQDNYFALTVPLPYGEKAKFEIWEYDRENQPPKSRVRNITPTYERAIPGAIIYVMVLALVTWLSETGAFGHDWLAIGRIDGALVRDGEWWRVITALTLHGSFKHLLGNIIFGTFFGVLAGGLVGPGLVWLCILVAAGSGNMLNILLLDAGHRSIGASTAVFAALGIISGFVWRAKLMAQERWAWRLGPIVGGIVLLAYTGTGDANTDIGAHLAGFACGFGTGTILTRLSGAMHRPYLQKAGGMLAMGIVCAAWLVALQPWN